MEKTILEIVYQYNTLPERDVHPYKKMNVHEMEHRPMYSFIPDYDSLESYVCALWMRNVITPEIFGKDHDPIFMKPTTIFWSSLGGDRSDVTKCNLYKLLKKNEEEIRNIIFSFLDDKLDYKKLIEFGDMDWSSKTTTIMCPNGKLDLSNAKTNLGKSNKLDLIHVLLELKMMYGFLVEIP